MERKTEPIEVQTVVRSSIEQVWACWTQPIHIVNWNFASDEWHCPSATNELKEDGTFVWRMESKDGQMGFDFSGTYERVQDRDWISYVMEDGRRVNIRFVEEGHLVRVTESFDPEGTHSDELQRTGWQSILDNFKAYVESLS